MNTSHWKCQAPQTADPTLPEGPSIHHHYGPVHIEQAQNVNTGPNYGTLSQHVACGGQPPLLFSDALPLALRPIPDASHTRDRRRSPPNSSCLSGTRKVVLGRLMGWAMDAHFEEPEQADNDGGGYEGDWEPLTWSPSPPETPPMPRGNQHVLWLCGPAGDGKSAVSQAICEMLQEQGRLLASFFFFRGSGDRSRIARFIVTLASQMVEVLPESTPLVAAALRSPSLQGSAVATQFHKLIVQPFRAVMAPAHNSEVGSVSLGKRPRSPTNLSGPYTIVVDGFDECDDRDDVADLIEAILELFDQNRNLPLRFLIVSRLATHIQGRLQGSQVHTENLHDHNAREDIVALADHTFKEAAKRYRVIRSFGRQWSSKEETQQLIRQADGSFIFIRTLLNFILGLESSRDDGMTPMERFQLSLGMNGLDSLYLDILDRSKHIPHFLDVILIITQLSPTLDFPLSISQMALILHIPPSNATNVLIPLQSIIYVPEDDDTPVRPFHASFIDFARDERRSGSLIPSSWMKNRQEELCYQILEQFPSRARRGLDLVPWIPHGWMTGLSSSQWVRLAGMVSTEPRPKRSIKFFLTCALRLMPRQALVIGLALFFACKEEKLGRYGPGLYPGRVRAAFPFIQFAEGDREEQYAEIQGLVYALERLTDEHRSCVQDELADQLQRPFQLHDPSISRCAVMHSMLEIMNMPYPSFPYELYWIEHLAVAIRAADVTTDLKDNIHAHTADREEVSAFLRSPYIPTKTEWVHRLTNGASETSGLCRAQWGAVIALQSRFPGLLATTPVLESAPGRYVVKAVGLCLSPRSSSWLSVVGL
ncbi:hypothetical protein FA13DRAFT_841388 [Coprinellus micaceus]|uniref:Nephrocystin 3-like N-terminal domain-containing protein n=1 Tax=Coprinellus micaceus TaxID=71717 RepID=A0A4Y7T156_COPMI|nr:hypothetical protein FA13DRAFT_841388 [Coprinellus micaceus]